MRVKLGDVCERGTSNLKLSDVSEKNGEFSVFGASGYIGSVDFYQQGYPYVAVVKDGAGIGRAMLCPGKTSVIGTMQYLLPKDNILPKYLFYVVKYMNLEKYFTGATIPHIYFKDYKNEEFNFDFWERQVEIVSVLSKCEKVKICRDDRMTRIRVPLGKFIKEYSERNKGNEDIPVYSVTNSQGFCTEYFGKEVASQDKTTYKIVPQGYFAYNPSRINVGSVDWQRYEKRVIVSPLYNVFSVSEGIDRQYLYYFLRSDLGRQMIKAKASGSVRDNLKLDMLKEMTIPDISVEQQKFCSSVLDKLHKLIQMRQQELQKLDEFIKARFVEMFGDVIHNSKKWQVCLFAEITSSRLGKMLDAKQQTGRNSYPYLANFNVQWFRFNLENLNKMDFDEKDRAEFELREGDLLVCEGGEIGRCAVWHNELQPCFFQKALHRVRCNHQIILPDYLAWWFRYNCDYGGFSALAGAKATIAHLPGAKLKQLQVAVPPMELQEQFAVFVAQTDKSKVAVQKALDEAQLLFDSLMQEYFG